MNKNPCIEDYISRAEALAKCHAVIATRDNGVGTIGLTYEDLKGLPAANVREIVYAEWIYNEITDTFVCSHCGDAMVRNTYLFCPWCGAIITEQKTLIPEEEKPDEQS